MKRLVTGTGLGDLVASSRVTEMDSSFSDLGAEGITAGCSPDSERAWIDEEIIDEFAVVVGN